MTFIMLTNNSCIKSEEIKYIWFEKLKITFVLKNYMTIPISYTESADYDTDKAAVLAYTSTAPSGFTNYSGLYINNDCIYSIIFKGDKVYKMHITNDLFEYDESSNTIKSLTNTSLTNTSGVINEIQPL